MKILHGDFAETIGEIVYASFQKTGYYPRPCSMADISSDRASVPHRRRLERLHAKYIIIKTPKKSMYVPIKDCEFISGPQVPVFVNDSPVAPEYKDKYGQPIAVGCLIAHCSGNNQHVATVSRITTRGYIWIKDFDDKDGKERRLMKIEGNVIVLNNELLESLMLAKLSR